MSTLVSRLHKLLNRVVAVAVTVVVVVVIVAVVVGGGAAVAMGRGVLTRTSKGERWQSRDASWSSSRRRRARSSARETTWRDSFSSSWRRLAKLPK